MLQKGDCMKIKVLHFSKVINRNDFIDMVIRFADPGRFEMMAAAYTAKSNIEDPEYKKAGIPFFDLEIGDGPWFIPVGARKLRALIRKERVNILHTHHYYESVMGWMATRGTSCKHVIGRHYHEEFYLTAKGIKLKLYLLFESIIQKAGALIVPSMDIANLVKKQRNAGRNLHVIPYGFDFTAKRYIPAAAETITQLRKELNLEGKFVVGNFARHHAIKGQEYLLQAFQSIHARVPEARLLMVGEGPSHDKLKQLASSLSPDVAIFTGWRKDAHLLMNVADVIVHPTLQEAFPQLMVEAMSIGKPLIITPVSGVSDHITDGSSGMIIPMRDAEAIVSAVLRVHADTAWAHEIGAKGADYVRTHLNAGDIVKKFESVYTNLCNANGNK